jgi:transcriptional antiterminator RfaH
MMPANTRVAASGTWRRDRFQTAQSERWYVVHTLPHQEAKAEYQLFRQGFRPFVPRLQRTVRHARKLRTVKSPAFNRYLFVPLDLDVTRWTPINGTFGVARLITAHERPQPVPAGVVEALLDYTDESGVLRFDRDLQVGQVVRVISGPFAKAIGQLDRLDSNNRVKVLLNIMGGVSATLDRAALQAA